MVEESAVDHLPRTGSELLLAGEQALSCGDSANAMELLKQASEIGVHSADVPRLARVFAIAARYQGRQPEVLAWIEGAIAVDRPLLERAALLRARVAVCRQVDLNRVLELAEEALQLSDEVGDEEAYANILANAAFAGYRRGDAHTANRYAERAASRAFKTSEGNFDRIRALMFAAAARDEIEAGLNLSVKARAIARELGRTDDVANESNNLAEAYLDLGCPAEARACASVAIALGKECGHCSVEIFGQVLCAIATAEGGDIDAALELFERIGDSHSSTRNPISAVDAALAHSSWLLERGAAGDAERARAIAETAIENATRAGVSNRLTSLHGNVARSWARAGNQDKAREAIERARQAADRAEGAAQSLFALAVAEVFPVSEARRRVTLGNARARILRSAEAREDPRAFCTNVRVNRRLLELSGGVPDDLPRAE